MAKQFLPVDRAQVMLLPPDLREWLPAGHLVWFVLDVIERLDTAALRGLRRLGGVGRRGYDPEMLLALLVYGYCVGQRSSRQIERSCEVDVAFRVICGGRYRPDHATIARFRCDFEAEAAKLFTDVLVLCAQAGLASVGVVAVDGTKIAADAGVGANRSRAAIEAEVRAMFREAAEVDAEQDRLWGDRRGDELPAELADPVSRRARLDAALRQLAERDDAAAARSDARAAALAQAAAQGRGLRGRKPKGADVVREAEARLSAARQRAALERAELEARYAARGEPVPGPPMGKGRRVARAEAALEQARRDAAQQPPDRERSHATTANVTDPDSRLLKTANGWVQGYNAQAAVNEQGVVLAAEITQDHGDQHQCQPMMAAVAVNLAAARITASIGVMLFDAGYWSRDNATAPGPDRLIATTKDWKRRKQLRALGTVTGPPPADANPKEQMEHRLCTAEGTQLYAKRSATVEPVFGHHKHNRGYRRFMRRGLSAVQAEWLLINATHNLLKVFGCQPSAV